MKFLPTTLEGIILIEPDIYRDARGFFLETFHAQKYRDGGVGASFVQDNRSRSQRGTIRGMHAQRQHPQGKLVQVIAGEIFDVAVDLRRHSPSFGRWTSVILSSENFRQLYVPPGFAHGFCVTSDSAEIEYKCTDFYNPADELHIRWNDPAIGITWPISTPILSEKDRSAPLLAEVVELLPTFQGAP